MAISLQGVSLASVDSAVVAVAEAGGWGLEWLEVHSPACAGPPKRFYAHSALRNPPAGGLQSAVALERAAAATQEYTVRVKTADERGAGTDAGALLG